MSLIQVKYLMSGKIKKIIGFRNYNSGFVDGIMHITLTKNNTLVTLTDKYGDVITWTSCANCGFIGSQKSTAIATITTVEEMGLRAKDLEMQSIDIIFHGGRRFRKAVINGLVRSKIRVNSFVLDLIVPYNGCRLEKKQRK